MEPVKKLGRPHYEGPPDPDIDFYVDAQRKGEAISKMVRERGFTNADWYTWLKRGSSPDMAVHLKYPQCRKLVLALQQMEKQQKEEKAVAAFASEIFLEAAAQETQTEIQKVLAKIITLISPRMGDGSKAKFLCDYCEQNGIHNRQTGEYACECVCHQARKLL